MLRAIAFGVLVLGALACASRPADAEIRATQLATKPFHPFRDLATRIVPSLLPPKGCTSDVISQAAELHVAPDLRGCDPTEVTEPIRRFFYQPPNISPTPPAAGALIDDQSPKPGASVPREVTFELFLPQPSAPQPNVAPEPSPPATEPNPAPTTPEAPPATNPPAASGGTQALGTQAPGDTRTSGGPTKPSARRNVVCPPGWNETSGRCVRNQLVTCAPGWDTISGRCVRERSRLELFADWFWDGLHPLLLVLGVLAVAGVVWLLKPAPIPLVGAPVVDVKLEVASPATHFDDPNHAVRDMLAVDVEMQPSLPAVHPPVTVTDVRILP